MGLIEKMKQGNIKALFPNLGMKIIANGCVCEILQVSSQQIKVEIIEANNSMYKIGNQIWVDSFLIYEKNEKIVNIKVSNLDHYTTILENKNGDTFHIKSNDFDDFLIGC